MELKVSRIHVCRVDTRINQKDQRDEDERNGNSSEDRERFMPAEAWMLCSSDSMREDQIDNVENRDTGIEEEIADELKAVVVRGGSPG